MDLAYHRADHEGVGTRPGQVDPVVMEVEGYRCLRPPEGFNWVFEHQVDFSIVQLELAPACWLARAAVYEVDGPVFFLEVPWGIFPLLVVVSPG